MLDNSATTRESKWIVEGMVRIFIGCDVLVDTGCARAKPNLNDDGNSRSVPDFLCTCEDGYIVTSASEAFPGMTWNK